VRLHTAEVDRYGPLRDCRPDPSSDITVVAGPNESGKTLYLEALLQLLQPDVTAHMDPAPRVDQSPTGRVLLEDAGDRHALGDGTTLSDVAPIEPGHLHDLFVVRDADLTLPDGPDYYTSLVEHLGNIHTTAIDDIRSELVDEGRLTPNRLNLSNQEYDTKDEKRTAETLAGDVEAYIENAEADDVPDLERRRLSVRRELAGVEADLEIQRTAEEVAAIEDAATQLDVYREATEHLQATAVDRDTLGDLRKREQTIDGLETRTGEMEATLERKREELAEKRQFLAEVRERDTRLAQREGEVDRVETALETHRDGTAGFGDDESFESRLAQRRNVTIAGLVGAGLSVGGGALAGSTPAMVLGVLLFVVAVGAWVSHRRLISRAAALEATEREVLQAARDAGFDVDAPGDVAPRVREYRDERTSTRSRVGELEATVEQLTARVEEVERELREKADEREELEGELTARLNAAGVDSIHAYEALVEQREDRRRERSEAETVLERELGDPKSEEPADRIAAWESELTNRRDGVGDAEVTAGAFDEATLEELQRSKSDLEGRLDGLTETLEAHGKKKEEFERRATELTPPPVVDADPSLEARTVEGLRHLQADLTELSSEIERNADVSRRAIGILDAIKTEEEKKVATLFDPEGPASGILAHLTEDRYTAVDYDPDTETLSVSTPDDRSLSVHQLSRGTRDQLYFAARLSLAQQVLGGDAGFLLLDDPFLAADPDRLRNGFETLQRLTAQGWQVLYFTAKPEVYDEMAPAFDCAVHELEQLEQ
jgi:uncharacterized protein YhaN